MPLVYTLPDGRQITQGQAFVLDGIKYPRNWLAAATLDELQDRGITFEEISDPDPEPPTVEQLLDYLGRKRVEVEEGGIVVNGVPVATDRLHSQVKITGAYVKAMADPEYQVTNWKIAPGVFIPLLDNATIIAIGDAVTDHVQACFDKEAELAAEITADPPTITTYEEIDAAAWPPNT